MQGPSLALLQAASGLRAQAKKDPRGLKNSRPGVSVKGPHSVFVVEEEQVLALVVVVRLEEAVEEEMVADEVVVVEGGASGVEEEQEEKKGGGGRVRGRVPVVEEFQTSSWEGWAKDATETMREQQKMDAVHDSKSVFVVRMSIILPAEGQGGCGGAGSVGAVVLAGTQESFEFADTLQASHAQRPKEEASPCAPALHVCLRIVVAARPRSLCGRHQEYQRNVTAPAYPLRLKGLGFRE
jgi:hypothetical protein